MVSWREIIKFLWSGEFLPGKMFAMIAVASWEVNNILNQNILMKIPSLFRKLKNQSRFFKFLQNVWLTFKKWCLIFF